MKTLFLSISLFWIGQVNAECIKLYIKEHLEGSPICYLKSGDYIEICEEENEINGCPRNFYVYDKGFSLGSLTYKLSLDKGWSIHYMTLMVNPTTQRFAFIIQGQTALYSYYTEAEMTKIQKQKEADYEISKSKIEKQNSEQDILTTNQIHNALKNKYYLKALNLYQNLNKENSDLLGEINKYFLPIKSKLDILYLDYLKEYQIAKKEYLQNPEKFISNNIEYIKEYQISLDGHAAFLKKINDTSNEEIKKDRELFLKVLKDYSFFYEKNNDKHLIAPVGLRANVFGNYGWRNYNNIKISVEFDTLVNSYLPFIKFYDNDSRYMEGLIINERQYNVKKYILPYSKGFKEIIDLAGGGVENNYILNNYPKQEIQLDYTESISFQKSAQEDIEYPENGTINDKWNELNKSFTKLNNKLDDYINYEPEIFSNEFYNPVFLYFIKELHPNSDSLVFVFADKNDKLDKINFMQIDYGYDQKYNIAYIIPLQKNKVELRGKSLKIYQTNGNYELININKIITNSLISLSFDKESLKLDTTYFSASRKEKVEDLFGKDYYKTIFYQKLFSFSQIKIGKTNPNRFDSSIIDAKSYRTNEKVIIQFLPIYDTGSQAVDFQYLHRPVFDYITEYLNYKEKGEIKKASKSLSKVTKNIERIKSTIQN